MAQKLKLRDLGMDTMERLYYERKEARSRAYTAKQRKFAMKKVEPAKRLQMKHDSATFDRALKQTLCNYNMC